MGFVYNEPCPLSCSFCCHTKENVGPGRLSPENVTPVLIGYARHDAVNRFAFTGGDPFIYIEEIIRIMTVARHAGVVQPFHIVTSGYWAEKKERISPLLQRLANLGMDMLYVSHDWEHKKWVSAQAVYDIEKACEAHGIRLAVYGVFWNQTDRVADLLPDLRTPHVSQTVASPIGRAKRLAHLIPKDLPLADKVSCRRAMDYDITIYPNGDTYPCCSGGFNKEAGLSLGNSFNDSAENIIDRCFEHFYVTIAKEIGFDKLIAKAAEMGHNVDSVPGFDEVSSACEMCVAIKSAPEVFHPDVLEAMEVEYCLDLYDKVCKVATHQLEDM